MTTHVFTTTEDAFKESKHPNDWFVFNDVTSLMTAKETIEWMKEQGCHS